MVTASGSYTVQTAVSSSAGTSLSVAPNPTPDGHLNVLLTGYHEPVELTLFDALGRIIGQTAVATPNPQSSTQALDLSRTDAGVYVLQVRTATSLETRRVVRE